MALAQNASHAIIAMVAIGEISFLGMRIITTDGPLTTNARGDIMLRQEKAIGIFLIAILLICLFAWWLVERRENSRVSRIIEAPHGTIVTDDLPPELKKAAEKAVK